MKKLLKFLIISISITIFFNTSANFTIEKPAENETITEKTYKVEGKCDSELILYMQKEKIISNQNYIDCKNGKYEADIYFSEINDGDKVFLVVGENADDGIVRNIIYDTRKKENKDSKNNGSDKDSKNNISKNENSGNNEIQKDKEKKYENKGSVPNKEALTLKVDPRVKLLWENTSFGEINEKKESKDKNENNSEENLNKKEESEKEEILEVTLENGNKFSHKRLSCEIPQNVKENLTKELKTNFTDISNSKFINEIKNLEDVKVIVGTSKNTFENREITKIELLGLVLKANCYDISTDGDWRKKVLSVGLENKIIDIETFKNNKNISKKDAFKIILKGGKIITPKVDSTDSMRYLGVFSENEKIYENMNLNRDEATNILVNILKLYRK